MRAVFITSVYIAAISAGGAIAMAQGKDAITKGDSYKLNESYSWAGPPWSGARLRNKRRGTHGGGTAESFIVLTWNSGGGQPTPEYLGGAWEHDFQGMFGEIEKLTGAMLFHIGKCKVHSKGKDDKEEDFPQGTDFEKFKFRYAEAWKTLQDFIGNNEGDIKDFMDTITPQKLLDGLQTVADRKNLPKWTEACTMDFVIGNKGEKGGPSTGLALCSKLHNRADDDKAAAAKCKFDLSNEACFPLRDGLPVYGQKFMELMDLDNKDPTKYWDTYTDSLLTEQDSWPAKGCKQDTKSDNPPSTPDEYMRRVLKPKNESNQDTDVIENSQYAPFTYEKWTQVAAWDKLVIRIARFAAEKILKKQLKEDAAAAGNETAKMKHIEVMPKDKPPEIIQGLVQSAATKMDAKVIFLQEGEKMDITGFDRRAATADTAVYIKDGFAKIDGARTKAAEGMWAKMVEEIKTAEKNIFPAAMSVLKPAKLRPEQLAKMVVDKEEGIEKTKWVSAKKLETIVVTTKGLMLLSIHADGDGYWCAQYLHVAKKLYDKLEPLFGLKSMIIGMDTNVQPHKGHLAFAKDKGLEFKQLEAATPQGMVLIEPKKRTVLKVRTFLQTQFGKIGKNDDVKKDMFFLYKAKGEGQAKVANIVKADGTFDYDDDNTKYFPKNEWPVDHFMVYHEVSADMAETDLASLTAEEVADAEELETTFADEVVEELKTAKTKTAPTLDKLAAAEEAKKPKTNEKEDVRWAACCYDASAANGALLTARPKSLGKTADCAEGQLDVDIMGGGETATKDVGNCSDLSSPADGGLNMPADYLTDFIKHRATYQPPTTTGWSGTDYLAALAGMKQRGKYKITKAGYEEALKTYRSASPFAAQVVACVKSKIIETVCAATTKKNCLTADQIEPVQSCYTEKMKLALEEVAKQVSTEGVSTEDLWTKLGGEMKTDQEGSCANHKDIVDYFWAPDKALQAATECKPEETPEQVRANEFKAKVVEAIQNRLKQHDDKLKHMREEIKKAIQNMEERTGTEITKNLENELITAVKKNEKEDDPTKTPAPEVKAEVRWAACCYNASAEDGALLTERPKGMFTTHNCAEGQLDVDIMGAATQDEGNCSELNKQDGGEKLNMPADYLTDFIKHRGTFQAVMMKSRGKYKITKAGYEEALETYRSASPFATQMVACVKSKVIETYCAATTKKGGDDCLTDDQKESVQSCYTEVVKKVSSEDLWTELKQKKKTEQEEQETVCEDNKVIVDYFWETACKPEETPEQVKAKVKAKVLKAIEDRLKQHDEKVKHTEKLTHMREEIRKVIQNIEESTEKDIPKFVENKLIKDVIQLEHGGATAAPESHEEEEDENPYKAKVVEAIKKGLEHRRDEKPIHTKEDIRDEIHKIEVSLGTPISPRVEDDLITKVREGEGDKQLVDIANALDQGDKGLENLADALDQGDKELENLADALDDKKKHGPAGENHEDNDEDGDKDEKQPKKKEKGCRVIRAVLARTIGPNGARVKAAFHNMREKIRAMNPLRKPKVAKTATASVTQPPSFAMKVKKSMSNLTSKAEHMIQRIFGRKTDGGEEEEEA